MQKIPFEVISLQADGFHIITQVSLLDKEFRMVIDTGASKTVLDKTTLLESGIQEDELISTDILSAGLGTNSMQSYMLSVPEFHIGDWVVRKFTCAVLDLSSINIAYKQIGLQPVVGVIGGDILLKYGAKIDYKRQTLQLNQRGRSLNKGR